MKKTVTFYSDGGRLAGDLYVPDVPAAERRAGVVLCHGYTGIKDLYLRDNARVLSLAGHVVLTFDYNRLVPPAESEHLYARAGQPKRQIVLKEYGHAEVYAEPAFSLVMEETLAWYRQYLLPSSPRPARARIKRTEARSARDRGATTRAAEATREEPTGTIPPAAACRSRRRGHPRTRKGPSTAKRQKNLRTPWASRRGSLVRAQKLPLDTSRATMYRNATSNVRDGGKARS